jgi:hypothetical protein
MSAGKRLLYQPLTGTMKAQRAGVGGAAMGDVTPAGEKFAKSCGKFQVERLMPRRRQRFLKTKVRLNRPSLSRRLARSEEAANLNLQGPSYGIDSNLPSLI